MTKIGLNQGYVNFQAAGSKLGTRRKCPAGFLIWTASYGLTLLI